ncbi:MAG: SDR family oxidoreductase, partial [Microbacterium sp.]|nr:SDR family oxidoreductase [Microbacterium sp.]
EAGVGAARVQRIHLVGVAERVVRRVDDDRGMVADVRAAVRADEVAAAVAYLALPEAGSTTGTILHVDGGMGSLRL